MMPRNPEFGTSRTHRIYAREDPFDTQEVFDTKKILPLLLLAIMVVTAGSLIIGHAVSVPKTAKAATTADNDDVQTNDSDDSQAGDTDDGNVQAGDQTDTDQTGTQGAADTQTGPDDNTTTGDQVEETGDVGATGMSDLATNVEQAIAF